MDHYEQNLKRKKEIEAGLLELMQTVPYSQITVTDLAGHLGISRKSFYHYFPGKEACLESLINRTFQESLLFVSLRTPSTMDHRQYYLHHLEYWKSQKDFLTAMIQNNLVLVLLNCIMDHMIREERQIQEELSVDEIPCDTDILLFYLSGQISILTAWCRRGFDTPVEEMVRKYIRLNHAPLISIHNKT